MSMLKKYTLKYKQIVHFFGNLDEKIIAVYYLSIKAKILYEFMCFKRSKYIYRLQLHR